MASKVTFLRRCVRRYSKLGKRRKKKQVWRRPTGRDNKMREKRKGYPVVVSIGYKSGAKKEEKIIVRNVKDLENTKSKSVLIGTVGRKKKIEILKEAKKRDIKITNVNEKKYLKKKEIPKETPKKEPPKGEENKK